MGVASGDSSLNLPYWQVCLFTLVSVSLSVPTNSSDQAPASFLLLPVPCNHNRWFNWRGGRAARTDDRFLLLIPI